MLLKLKGRFGFKGLTVIKQKFVELFGWENTNTDWNATNTNWEDS